MVWRRERAPGLGTAQLFNACVGAQDRCGSRHSAPRPPFFKPSKCPHLPRDGIPKVGTVQPVPRWYNVSDVDKTCYTPVLRKLIGFFFEFQGRILLIAQVKISLRLTL